MRRVCVSLIFVSMFLMPGLSFADLLSSGKTYTLVPEPNYPNSSYLDSGHVRLTNGLLTSSESVRWWPDNSPVIVVDLGSLVTCESVSYYVFDSDGGGSLPTQVSISISSDGVNFSSVGLITSFIPYGGDSSISVGSFSFVSTVGRYVKYIPSGGYAFITEVEVYGSLSTPTPTPTPIDSTPPIGTVTINSGASSTNSTTVTLTLSSTDNVGVSGYYLSESSTIPLVSASGWSSVVSTMSYSDSVSGLLSSGDGLKTVYAWYKDDAGNVSSTASDTITLDTSPPATPTPTTTPAPTPTPTPIPTPTPEIFEGVIYGMVVDKSEDPMSEISVRLSNMSGTYTASSSTDNDGYYFFESLYPDTFELSVSKLRFGSVVRSVSIGLNQVWNESYVKLLRGNNNFRLSGVVTNDYGDLLKAVRIRAKARGIKPVYTYSDGDGNYLFVGLHEEEYTITYYKDGYVTLKKQLEMIGDDSLNVVLDAR